MNIEKILIENKTTPIGRAIEPIATALSKHTVFVPMVGNAPGPNGGKMSLFVGEDNEGNTWAYAYTNLQELNKAMKQGAPMPRCSSVNYFQFLKQTSISGVCM